MKRMNLVVLIAGIFTMFCNFANSESVDCVTLCNECVEVWDTLTHIGCTKHCEEHEQNENGKMSCSKLTAPNKGSVSLGVEINAIGARVSELIESGADYSAIVEELYADDCINVNYGQAPVFGKKDTKQEYLYYFGRNPNINRVTFTSSAFGENNGKVWEDGIGKVYQNDALIDSFRYMFIYKRVDGTLLRFFSIYFE
ncbi:uncharacterized protein [Amphiura filiformis]|uniref:uncharacterized protein n=1 Tax=Amphiura filiformis TaxID=82378 RepID=UPI003B227643